ncbi:hypothetical protein WDW37_19515 [Bdellovibrionota bacterium FG-1]
MKIQNETREKPLFTTRQREVLIALAVGVALAAFLRPTPSWY